MNRLLSNALKFAVVCAALNASTEYCSAEAGAVSATDQKFLKEAAQSGIAEVKLGELGKQKAQNAEVKSYAAMMVKDHSAANEKLMAVAKEVSVEVPDSPSPSASQALKQLEATDGDKFDQAFMKQMLTDHKKAVADFEAASKGAQNPKVKKFAADTLPTLKEHLEHAEKVEGMTDKKASMGRTDGSTGSQ